MSFTLVVPSEMKDNVIFPCKYITETPENNLDQRYVFWCNQKTGDNSIYCGHRNHPETPQRTRKSACVKHEKQEFLLFLNRVPLL
jgi:hypothetical protein